MGSASRRQKKQPTLRIPIFSTAMVAKIRVGLRQSTHIQYSGRMTNHTWQTGGFLRMLTQVLQMASNAMSSVMFMPDVVTGSISGTAAACSSVRSRSREGVRIFALEGMVRCGASENTSFGGSSSGIIHEGPCWGYKATTPAAVTGIRYSQLDPDSTYQPKNSGRIAVQSIMARSRASRSCDQHLIRVIACPCHENLKLPLKSLGSVGSRVCSDSL